ncbi:helix-turn-helix domain-containing protein [Rhodovulum iodosum]|nr:helix-turn-helix transcriptional regulator [Rhodovulum robiginosum]RSK31507.1 helix-turn-helix domain-containing protein [Rhodovulum robiginosum]
MTEVDENRAAPEFLTVRELAELLRIKERKVYELAASGEVPVSRVTGKLLFPERDIRAWIAGGSSGGPAGPAVRRPDIFLGSHDPLLDWAIRQSRCGLATRFDGSLDGLSRFAAAEGVASGLHIRDAASGEWNLPRVAAACADQNAVLVAWARRRKGLVVRPEDKGRIGSIADLVGRTVVPRPPETGTQAMLEDLLAAECLDPADLSFCESAPTEDDAVRAVAQGGAEIAFGLESGARLFGLHFVPVVEERFDLLVDRAAWFEPPLQRLLAFCGTDSFRAHAAATPGYDISELGTVRWNA